MESYPYVQIESVTIDAVDACEYLSSFWVKRRGLGVYEQARAMSRRYS
jgi:hypothetical protein